MFIANPIYDVVFKYLMEDQACAKGIISGITGKEITHLDLKPQEITHEEKEYLIGIHRIDFHATIKEANGETHDVIIEIQKSDVDGVVQRFRNYLGDRYKDPDWLPIITIYFLNFMFKNKELPAVIHVNRQYTNASTGKALAIKDQFIEKLTHDSTIIQIPKLAPSLQTTLDKMLRVFSQKYVTNDGKQIKLHEDESTIKDPILQKIIRRLTKAWSDADVRKKMEIEDEIHLAFEAKAREKEELLVVIDKKNKTIDEEKKRSEEKDKTISDQDKEIAELKKQLAKAKK